MVWKLRMNKQFVESHQTFLLTEGSFKLFQAVYIASVPLTLCLITSQVLPTGTQELAKWYHWESWHMDGLQRMRTWSRMLESIDSTQEKTFKVQQTVSLARPMWFIEACAGRLLWSFLSKCLKCWQNAVSHPHELKQRYSWCILLIVYEIQELVMASTFRRRSIAFEGSHFRIGRTTRHFSVVVCLYAYGRICSISASRYTQHIARIWQLARVFFVLTTEASESERRQVRGGISDLSLPQASLISTVFIVLLSNDTSH